MKILDLVDDVRSGCKSVLTTMTLEEYKKLSFFAFNNNGNIDGQRSVIKRSSTAAKIRKRMADDFRKGAIFPQVVLGVLFSTENMQNLDESKFYMLLESVNEGRFLLLTVCRGVIYTLKIMRTINNKKSVWNFGVQMQVLNYYIECLF